MSSEVQTTSLSSAMGTQVVTIYVGKKRKEFVVHKKLICDSAKFFDDAFNGPFKEGQEGIMYMPEDDSDSFSLFVDYLYRNALSIIQIIDSKTAKPTIQKEFGPLTKAEHVAEFSKMEKEEREKDEKQKIRDNQFSEQINRLLKLYCFGERFFIKPLMNQTMDRIRQGLSTYKKFLTADEIKFVYENTNQKSMLRTFTAELMVYTLALCSEQRLNQLSSLMREMPDLTMDMLLEFREIASSRDEHLCRVFDDEIDPDPRDRGSTGGCFFHTHDDSEHEMCEKDNQSHWLCIECGEP